MRTRRGRAIGLGVYLALTALPAAGGARDNPQGPRPIQEQLAAAAKTSSQIEAAVEANEERTRARVRTLYKLARAGAAPLWMDQQARGEALRRRAAARRMILRDLAERKILRDALAAANRNELRLEMESLRQATSSLPALALGSLVRPVPGRVLDHFGIKRDAPTKAHYWQRGLTLQTERADKVYALAAGRVVYVGELKGLGPTIVVDHADATLSVLGGLWKASVNVGANVEAGEVVGWAWDRRLYVEVRRAGRPVDPEPLFDTTGP